MMHVYSLPPLVRDFVASFVAAAFWASIGVTYRGEWVVKLLGGAVIQGLALHAVKAGSWPVAAVVAHGSRNGEWS